MGFIAQEPDGAGHSRPPNVSAITPTAEVGESPASAPGLVSQQRQQLYGKWTLKIESQTNQQTKNKDYRKLKKLVIDGCLFSIGVSLSTMKFEL